MENKTDYPVRELIELNNFADKLDTFLRENLTPLSVNAIIYKDADFQQLGLSEEVKTTHFIKVYNGLFYVGIFDPNKGLVNLEKLDRVEFIKFANKIGDELMLKTASKLYDSALLPIEEKQIFLDEFEQKSYRDNEQLIKQIEERYS